MKLLDGEKVLLESRDLLLTTHRVRYQARSRFTSIMLEQVCSVEGGHRSFILLLLLAIALLAVAATIGYSALSFTTFDPASILAMKAKENTAWAFFWPGAVFLALYCFVRPKSIVIHAAGGPPIRCPLGILGGSAGVHDFVDTLEAAKHERLKVRCTGMPDRQALPQ